MPSPRDGEASPVAGLRVKNPFGLSGREAVLLIVGCHPVVISSKPARRINAASGRTGGGHFHPKPDDNSLAVRADFLVGLLRGRNAWWRNSPGVGLTSRWPAQFLRRRTHCRGDCLDPRARQRGSLRKPIVSNFEGVISANLLSFYALPSRGPNWQGVRGVVLEFVDQSSLPGAGSACYKDDLAPVFRTRTIVPSVHR